MGSVCCGGSCPPGVKRLWYRFDGFLEKVGG